MAPSCSRSQKRGGTWCVAYNCSNAWLKKKPDLLFFWFPKNEQRWVNYRYMSTQWAFTSGLEMNVVLA